MIRKAIYALIVFAGAAMALATIHPATAVTSISQVHSTPIATPTLPACEHEDGSGQALCMWDAQSMGNGLGTDAVSGECAVDSIGIDSESTSALCVRVWEMDARTVQLSDGAFAEYPKGNELVGECSDIEWEAVKDKTVREELNADGWTMAECLRGMLSDNG
jgi:hypothetical protein